MTKDEALKLALEALENIKNDPFKFDLKNGIDKAITTIKEALAQPEQERFLVATIGNWGRVEWADGVFPSLGDKMYSAPRTWVGLTDKEIIEMLNYGKYGHVPQYVRNFVDAIEAKLKEKNT
jgi:hypothetical protein